MKNIQDEVAKIHAKYGTTEKANYEIQKLFDEMLNQQNLLQLAIAQFTGWSLGRTNPESLEELVLSMGLTKEEWALIKKDKFVTETSWLSKDDIQTINDYFKHTNKKA